MTGVSRAVASFRLVVIIVLRTSIEYPEIFLEALSIDPGDRGIYREHNTSYQISDSMSYTAGSHSLKWGAGSYRIDVNNLSTSTASLYDQTVADFIANRASNASLVAGNPGSLTRGFQVGLFVEDTWQARPGLTIDYGLRWDYETPIYDPTGRAQTFDTRIMMLGPPAGAYYHPNCNAWGPPLGIAWQVTPRVVVRTGYGIFYQVYPVGFGAYSVPTNNIPGNTNLTQTETPNLSYPLSQFVGQGTSPLPTVAGFNWNKPDIYSQQWNFTLAYALSGSQTLQVAYIGNHGLNLRRVRRLETEGIIEGYGARIKRTKVGLGLTAFVAVKLERPSDPEARHFRESMQRLPQVLSCYLISGKPDFLLEVTVSDSSQYSNSLLAGLRELPQVKDMQSSFVLDTVKQPFHRPGVP